MGQAATGKKRQLVPVVLLNLIPRRILAVTKNETADSLSAHRLP